MKRLIIATSVVAQQCYWRGNLVQVQDADTNFRDVFYGYKEALARELRGGGEWRLGLSSFSDKPGPLMGFGDYGLWGPEYPHAHVRSDYCYQNNARLGLDDLWEVQWKLSRATEENQFDAVAKAASDRMHWGTEANELKVVALVTSNLAHVVGFDGYHPYWGWDTSARGAYKWWDQSFGDFWEDYYYGRIRNDMAHTTGTFSYGGQDLLISGTVLYKSLVACFGMGGVSTQLSDDFRRGTIRDLEKCGVVVTGSADQWFADFCLAHQPNMQGRYSGVFSFANDRYVEVAPYNYDDPHGMGECSNHEYADPTSTQFARLLLSKDIILVVVVAQPRVQSMLDASLRYLFFSQLSNHCPEVRDSCPSLWHNACTGPQEKHSWHGDVLQKKIDQCYEEHYERLLQPLRVQRVPVIFKMIQEDLTSEVLAAAVAAAVKEAQSQHVLCEPTTTTAAADSTDELSSATKAPPTEVVTSEEASDPISTTSEASDPISTTSEATSIETEAVTSEEASDPVSTTSNTSDPISTTPTGASVVVPLSAGVTSGVAMAGVATFLWVRKRRFREDPLPFTEANEALYRPEESLYTFCETDFAQVQA
ncbi:MAG: hypothetical protein KVP17_001896 [Porospora cf. gigantea B]|uniref:uncharacterized protein n=1 Tax=Porospora cf. gigantea B TaxID=2853592 RepID=UPI00357183CE|nr:MAG: hypothetical protein KVP17_001896 [Porospora cf. gigantea B]